MSVLLHLDSSPRTERSHSRQLSRAFVDTWKQAHPQDSVLYRDLGHQPPPHVTEPWIAGAYTPAESLTPELKEALRVSNELIDELLSADLIALGAPMHNFGITSSLKTYLDQVIRVGRTFEYPSYKGLALGKRLVVLTSRGGGGYGPGEPMHSFNLQEPTIKNLFGFIGITDVTFLHDEKTSQGDSELENSIARARDLAKEFILKK
jgi:FMN-dependent NADH-azoreductase